MESIFNFKLNNNTLSKACKLLDLNDFNQVCNYIKHLPYGRTKERSNYVSILEEHKGTCSTKHAFLKQLAIENEIETIKLYLGIYKMNDANTSGIASVLKKYNLNYIPEAHTYLKIDNTVLDVTRLVTSKVSFETSLLNEVEILPEQISAFKVNYHQDYLKKWIASKKIPYSFKKIWDIREECIANL